MHRTFRAKSIEPGNYGSWVYGLYLKGKWISHIYTTGKPRENWNIDETTLGQCTGLKDKNGNYIYEGDKVKVTLSGIKAEIIWDKRTASFMYKHHKTEYLPFYANTVRVVGNIHDGINNKVNKTTVNGGIHR